MKPSAIESVMLETKENQNVLFESFPMKYNLAVASVIIVTTLKNVKSQPVACKGVSILRYLQRQP